MAKYPINSAILWPVVVLVIAALIIFTKPWQQTTQTISVSAEGKAEVTPDIAQILATIETQNQNLDLARSQNEQKVQTIIGKLKELGVREDDIKTQSISADQGIEPLIYPPRRIDTNSFSTSLDIKIRNFEIADEILATLTQNGATYIYGPNLTLSDEKKEQAKSQARQKAVENAKAKGEELAKLSQRKLGKATSIKEQGDFGYPIPITARSEADLKEKASSIQPGQNEVTVTLAVEFALK